jgi:hypothetical protein
MQASSGQYLVRPHMYGFTILQIVNLYKFVQDVMVVSINHTRRWHLHPVTSNS